MSLQGPVLIVGSPATDGLIQALANAGAFPVIETGWRDAPSTTSNHAQS
jgi:hypothetical protein